MPQVDPGIYENAHRMPSALILKRLTRSLSAMVPNVGLAFKARFKLCRAMEHQRKVKKMSELERIAVVNDGPRHGIDRKGSDWLMEFRRRVEDSIKAEGESPFLVRQKIAQIRERSALLSGIL
jgi:hypothetical protein